MKTLGMTERRLTTASIEARKANLLECSAAPAEPGIRSLMMHPINDKTALTEVAEFERAPREFSPRVQKTLGSLGTAAVELVAAVDGIAQLLREVAELADGLYQPRYTLPK